MYAPSQWEMALHCNAISRWLSAYTEWSLVLLKLPNSYILPYLERVPHHILSNDSHLCPLTYHLIDLFHKWFMSLKSKSGKNVWQKINLFFFIKIGINKTDTSLLSPIHYTTINYPIGSQFCTSQDSWSVVICANLWLDWIIRIITTVKTIFISFHLRTNRSSVKWVLGQYKKKSFLP